MYEVIDMKLRPIIFGFITGAVVAGVTTIMTAPSSGRELREKIQSGKHELFTTFDDLSLKIRRMQEAIVEAGQVSIETGKTFVSDVQSLIENWKNEIEPNKTELINNVQEIEQSIHELEKTLNHSKNNE